jgi:hypothetical protein
MVQPAASLRSGRRSSLNSSSAEPDLTAAQQKTRRCTRRVFLIGEYPAAMRHFMPP